MSEKAVSPAWNYFYQENPNTIQCSLCDLHLPYSGNEDDLAEHIKDAHGVILMKSQAEEQRNITLLNVELIDDPIITEDSSDKKFKKRSTVWKFFTQVGNMLVRCNICRKTLKYYGSTTNMNSHLKCKHTDGPFDYMKKDSKAEESNSDDEVESVKSSTSVERRMTRQQAQKHKVQESTAISNNSAPTNVKLAKTEVKQILVDSRNFLEKATELLKPQTELDHFGKYVAAQLNKLNPADQMAAQKDIISTLTAYMLKNS